MKTLILVATIAAFIVSPFSTVWASDGGVSTTDESAFPLSLVDTPPKAIRSYSPVYPPQAEANLYEGRVVLQFIVTKEGGVKNVEVVDSVPAGVFDESSKDAILKYKFSPGIKDGVPVNTIVKLPISFELENTDSSYDFYVAYQDGEEQIETGKYSDAIVSLSKAIDIYPEFYNAYYLRGIAYKATDEYDNAKSDFKKAIKLFPEEGKYYLEMGKLNLLLGKYGEAIDNFNTAIEIYPDMADAYFNRGEAFRLYEQYEKAVSDYTLAILLDDENVQAYNNRGYSYNKLNDMEKTCRDMQKACNLGDCRGLEILQKAGNCSAEN